MNRSIASALLTVWGFLCAWPGAVEASSRAQPPVLQRKALLSRMQKTPGESAMVLRNYIQQKFVLGGEAALERVFGPGVTDASLRSSFTPVHEHAELRPENFLTVPLREAGEDRPAVGVIGLLTRRGDGHPLGYFIRTFHEGEPSHRWDELDYIAVDLATPSAKGLGRAMRERHDHFLKAWGSARTELTAAWLGRLVWAKEGYLFADAGERDRTRRKFRLFQTHFQLADEELYLERADGAKQPFALEHLVEPADFAALRSQKRKLTVPVMESAEKVAPQTLEVGAAFLLGSHFDKALGQLFLRKYHAARPN